MIIDAARLWLPRWFIRKGYLLGSEQRESRPFVKRRPYAHVGRSPGRADAVGFVLRGCLNRGEFLDLMRSGTVDWFRQRGEVAFAVPDRGFPTTALTALRRRRKLAVVTRRRKGLAFGVLQRRRQPRSAAFPIDKIVDHHRAATCFAADFCRPGGRGAGFEDAGRLGALAAADK